MLTVVLHAKKPTRKQAHLLAPTLKADASQAKEPVLCQRSEGNWRNLKKLKNANDIV